MSARLALAVCLGVAALAQSARAAGPAADPFGTPVPAQDLTAQRGGSDGGLTMQVNATSQTASNSGDFTVAGGQSATLNNGAVTGTQVSGNSGITTVMTNTGNQVNLSNSTNVIVNMQ